MNKLSPGLISTLFLSLFSSGVCLKAQSFVNPSMENWGSPSACEVNTPPDSWTDYSNGGIGLDEANFSFCATTIPPAPADGIVYARSYGATTTTGEGIYQVLTGFMINSSYLISYEYAGSNLYGGTGPIQWHLFIDDQDLDQTVVFQSTDAVWTSHSFVFTATATSHKIGFRLYASTGNVGSGAIDHIDIGLATGSQENMNDNSISLYPNPVKDKLTFEFKDADNAVVEFFDCLGNIITLDPIREDAKITYNTSGMSSGIYFARINSGKGFIVKKFVVE